ncbi:hypothetical protein VWS50_22715, partial [Xanthomonas citri pv. citri]
MLVGLLLPLVLLTNMSVQEFQVFQQYQYYRRNSKFFSTEQLEEIKAYGEQVSGGDLPIVDPFAEKNDSNSTDVLSSELMEGAIGYLSIPKIEIRQPIY